MLNADAQEITVIPTSDEVVVDGDIDEENNDVERWKRFIDFCDDRGDIFFILVRVEIGRDE